MYFNAKERETVTNEHRLNATANLSTDFNLSSKCKTQKYTFRAGKSTAVACEVSAPISLYSKSSTGLTSRSHSLNSPISTRSHSVHSLIDIPPPPKPPKSDLKKAKKKSEITQTPKVNVYSSRDGLHRTESYDRLDKSDAVSLSYSEYQQHQPHPNGCIIPPYSELRSVSAEHHQDDYFQNSFQNKGSNLQRTISRATLVDQDTGNVYQVLLYIIKHIILE